MANLTKIANQFQQGGVSKERLSEGDIKHMELDLCGARH